MARGIHCECLTNIGTVQQTNEISWPCCGIQSSEHAVVGLFLFLTKIEKTNGVLIEISLCRFGFGKEFQGQMTKKKIQ